MPPSWLALMELSTSTTRRGEVGQGMQEMGRDGHARTSATARSGPRRRRRAGPPAPPGRDSSGRRSPGPPPPGRGRRSCPPPSCGSESTDREAPPRPDRNPPARMPMHLGPPGLDAEGQGRGGALPHRPPGQPRPGAVQPEAPWRRSTSRARITVGVTCVITVPSTGTSARNPTGRAAEAVDLLAHEGDAVEGAEPEAQHPHRQPAGEEVGLRGPRRAGACSRGEQHAGGAARQQAHPGAAGGHGGREAEEGAQQHLAFHAQVHHGHALGEDLSQQHEEQGRGAPQRRNHEASPGQIATSDTAASLAARPPTPSTLGNSRACSTTDEEEGSPANICRVSRAAMRPPMQQGQGDDAQEMLAGHPGHQEAAEAGAVADARFAGGPGWPRSRRCPPCRPGRRPPGDQQRLPLEAQPRAFGHLAVAAQHAAAAGPSGCG